MPLGRWPGTRSLVSTAAGVLVAMSVSILHPSLPAPPPTGPAPSPSNVPAWWPLARAGTFVPLDREQCWSFLGRSGTGWLSRPGAVVSSRQPTTYRLTAAQLRLKPPPSVMLPVGQIVLFQVDHFNADDQTAWSIAMVGRTAERSAVETVGTNARQVFLPLASTGIYGLTLAAATQPRARLDAGGPQG